MAYDFKYSVFWLSKPDLIEYIKNFDRLSGDAYASAYSISQLLDCIIENIAAGNVEFNTKDVELCDILEELVVKAGKQQDGTYTQTARQAMRKLCTMQGKQPDAVQLYDTEKKSWWKKATGKVKSFFGFNKKSEEKTQNPEQIVEPTPDMVKPTPDTVEPMPDTVETTPDTVEPIPDMVEPVPDTVKATPDTVEPVPDTTENPLHSVQVPQKTTVEPHNAVKDKNSRDSNLLRTAVVSGAIIVGLGLIGIAKAHLERSQQTNQNLEPKKEKTENTKSNLNLSFSSWQSVDSKISSWPQSLQSIVKKKTTEEQKTTDAEIAKINACCNSSLNILIGEKARNKLYTQIRNQVKNGIFQIPGNMSVERVAHAITMSRIYEGKSIILDALNSKQKLTQEQQKAFVNHIESIGVNGVGLQKRMAAKQKLSSHSKYDTASKSLKVTHAKNLKQLRQMRGISR